MAASESPAVRAARVLVAKKAKNVEREPLFGLADRLGVLLEALPDGVVIIGPRGSIAYVNTRLEELTGHRREELLGCPLDLLIPERLRDLHKRHRYRFDQAPLLRPMGTGLDISLLCRDGSEIPVDIQVSPVEFEGKRFTMAAIRYIAERKDAEDAAREIDRVLAMAMDRERIARLLSDGVIHSLFGIGLELQALSVWVKDQEGAARMDRLVADLDQLIQQIRGQVFALTE